MNVSHFELIFKPQSPEPPADIVLQGYFLSLTNLEDVDLSFRLDFVTGPVTETTRTLAGNTVVVVDIAGDDNDFDYQLAGDADDKSFFLTPLVRVPAHATAKIAVFPADPFPTSLGGDGTTDPADYEARGYVTLRLPAILQRRGDRFLTFVEQLDRPANVLLTPQNRATYFRNGTIEGQTQAGLPLASGSALNEVEPESFSLRVPDLDRDFDLSRLTRQFDIDRLPEQLAEVMAVMAASDADLKPINAALREAGVGMALERRQVSRQSGRRETEDA
jgi:hypothetical protein